MSQNENYKIGSTLKVVDEFIVKVKSLQARKIKAATPKSTDKKTVTSLTSVDDLLEREQAYLREIQSKNEKIRELQEKNDKLYKRIENMNNKI